MESFNQLESRITGLSSQLLVQQNKQQQVIDQHNQQFNNGGCNRLLTRQDKQRKDHAICQSSITAPQKIRI